MKFSVSMNNDTSVPYIQYGTDRQKAQAKRFANASDRELRNMALEINHHEHSNSKFERNMGVAILSLPAIAGIATAVATKGKLSSRMVAGSKSLGTTAAYMGIGALAAGLNSKIANNNPKIKNAEKKHPITTFLGIAAAAVGASIGFDKVVAKVSPKVGEKLTKIGRKINIEKFARKIDNAPEGIKKTLNGLAEKISLPKGVKEKMSSIASKIKVPQIIKDGANKIKNLEVTKSLSSSAKKVAGFAKRNPASAAAIAIVGLIVANGVKRSAEVSATKAKLKDAQLKTANNLIEAYSRENNSLKVSNALVANKLDEAKSIAAEDSTDSDVE